MGSLYYFNKFQIDMVFYLPNNDAIKPAFSAAELSMKFIIFNLFGAKLNNPFDFKTIFKYEVRFNILNPEWACG
jgi:hypothetical protein